jgi:ribosome maturation factor RimP
MAMSADELHQGVAPLLGPIGLELYDAEVGRSTVSVTVTKPGGVTLDDLASANAAISTWLDAHEPFESRYTLEVTSPGVERSLRRPSHFQGAVGEEAKLKVDADVEPSRRLEGTIRSADDVGVVIETSSGDRHVPYQAIERARTAFSWGASKKPSPSRAGAPKGPKRIRSTRTEERITAP